MRGKLLLVEDEADARRSLARALVRDGYECIEASDVESALAAAERNPDLAAAVVDIVLGSDERGGVRLVPLLRGLIPRLSVIAITAFANVGNVKQLLNEGAAFLLEKPFRAVELLEALARVLAEQANMGPWVERALAPLGLTVKELAIARLLLKGLPTGEIARLENNSDKTIRQHLSQVYAKAKVSSRSEFFHFVFPS
ncbi:MAG TPA: response regulator [Polyangiaceae bacterium]|nr:response regulator [Polyangiaceae bacterium]